MQKSITEAFIAYLQNFKQLDSNKRELIINSFMLQNHLATYDVRLMLETCFRAYLEEEPEGVKYE